jgi:ketosteroid isomerase-like protein
MSAAAFLAKESPGEEYAVCMVRPISMLTCALFLACGSRPAAQQPATGPATAVRPATAEVRGEIAAAYDGYARAVMDRDIAAMMTFITDDAEWRLADGTVQHRAEIEPDLKKFIASLPAGAVVSFTVDRVTAKSPDKAVVDAVMHLDAGDKHTTVGWLDTWVKGPSGWQSSHSIEKPPQN